ncbi:Isoleucine--tRNA ligase [Methyloligella halotolerans]|uniref:Isoleucine--tRNA ligase n=1 Tax=Methyloligella halotolerans TaxID=1177755 RepID=A0A1E2RY97_9HYPH|nr:Isoleucine--tRNA ligase [Methyloligella halotolerans]
MTTPPADKSELASNKTAEPASGSKEESGRNWSDTLFLPKTDFPMKAGLPQREPELIARWNEIRLYDRLREEAKGRGKFVLHDGPPYANGHLHIGHALNKTLKDVVVRSQGMMGKDAPYVPGWDCHGSPSSGRLRRVSATRARTRTRSRSTPSGASAGNSLRNG